MKLDKPLVIFVCDEAAGCEGFDKLEEVVFKNEKVALGMKAFRTVKMNPSAAEKEPLLADAGSEIPRLVVFDNLKNKAVVVEKGKLTASGLYNAMKKVADAVYEQKLDGIVKDHLKLLTERDQLANEEKVLAEKETRLSEEADKNKKDLAELKEERTAVQKQLEEISTKEKDLWKLTPKTAKAA